MKKSKDRQVQQWIEELKDFDDGKYKILMNARAMVFDACPRVSERIMYGGIMFSLGEDDFGGLFVSKKHVSFEFSQGFKFSDPQGVLEGSGKFRRHLKFYELIDIENKGTQDFVKQVSDS